MLARFLSTDRGMAMIEYGLLGSLIAFASLVAIAIAL